MSQKNETIVKMKRSLPAMSQAADHDQPREYHLFGNILNGMPADIPHQCEGSEASSTGGSGRFFLKGLLESA